MYDIKYQIKVMITEHSSVCFFVEKRDGPTIYERDRRQSRICGRHTAGNTADNTSWKPACCLTLQAWDIYGFPVCLGFWYNREWVCKAYIQMGIKVLYAWQVALSCPSICRTPFSGCNDGTFAKWRNNTRYGGADERMITQLQISTPSDG